MERTRLSNAGIRALLLRSGLVWSLACGAPAAAFAAIDVLHCDPHTPRKVVDDPGAGTFVSLSYVDLCDLEKLSALDPDSPSYSPMPDHLTQYGDPSDPSFQPDPGFPPMSWQNKVKCPAGQDAWPRCLGSANSEIVHVGDAGYPPSGQMEFAGDCRPLTGQFTTDVICEPDRGVRYPLIHSSDPGDRITQDLDQDRWPVCAKLGSNGATVDEVVSQTSSPTCPSGFVRVGTCEASAHYNERLKAPNASGWFKAHAFYTFRANDEEAVCRACAHDPLTAVRTCKSLCNRYFGPSGLGWCVDTSLPGDAGRWTIEETCTGATEVHHPMDTAGSSPNLDECLENCGPPFDDGNGGLTKPPWVSGWDDSNKVAETELDNHWHEVTYGRGWDPDNLDKWLRSYTVNKDKDNAPRNVCNSLVFDFCQGFQSSEDCKLGIVKMGSLVPLESIPALDPAAFDDRRDELQATWGFLDRDGRLDFGSGGAFVGGSGLSFGGDSFCDHFYRGNALCPKSCFTQGNDGEDAPLHQCGFDTTGEIRQGLAGNCLNEAVCECNGDGCGRVEVLFPHDPLGRPAEIGANASDQVPIIVRFLDSSGNVLAPIPGTTPEVVNLTTGAQGSVFTWGPDAWLGLVVAERGRVNWAKFQMTEEVPGPPKDHNLVAIVRLDVLP